MCGGTHKATESNHELAGLSPRVRGNRWAKPCNEKFYRSIPACAGEPRVADRMAPVEAVYPRVCGGT